MKFERMKSSNDKLVITAIELIAEMFEYAKCIIQLIFILKKDKSEVS